MQFTVHWEGSCNFENIQTILVSTIYAVLEKNVPKITINVA